jgi:hypothetical protein
MKISRTIFTFLKNIENRVAWFLAELCKAEKGVQKDKRNQRRTELVRGRCLAPHIAMGRCQFQIWGSSSQLLWARSGFLDATIIGLP